MMLMRKKYVETVLLGMLITGLLINPSHALEGTQLSGFLELDYKPVENTDYYVSFEKDKTEVWEHYKPKNLKPLLPLIFGDGYYKINIWKSTNKNSNDVEKVWSKNVNYKAGKNEEIDIYLKPNLFVNWTDETEVVRVAKEITKGAATVNEKVTIIHDYIINNYVYDVDLLNDVTNKYISYLDVDKTYKRKTGLCGDLSMTMVIMCRSLGIPARLAMGNEVDKPTMGHAWVEVFVDNNWHEIDITYDVSGKSYGYKNLKNVLDTDYSYTLDKYSESIKKY